jgi:hypothetical protein
VAQYGNGRATARFGGQRAGRQQAAQRVEGYRRTGDHHADGKPRVTDRKRPQSQANAGGEAQRVGHDGS